MNKVMFYVDGFNLYHSIKNVRYKKYKWLNLRKLCESFVLKSTQEIADIKYFTAFYNRNVSKVKKHKLYIRALESVGVEVIYGKFRYKDKKCPRCKSLYTDPQEKRTDVNIAINIYADAMNGKYDVAMIISADSDLIPAIEMVKKDFPEKDIRIIIPINRNAEELKKTVNYNFMRIGEKQLKTCQFDNPLYIGKDKSIELKKPDKWK